MPRLVSDDMPTTCRRAVGLFYILLTATAITCTRRRKSGRRKPEAIASATEGSADRSNPADWAFYFCALQTHPRSWGSRAYAPCRNEIGGRKSVGLGKGGSGSDKFGG